LIIAQPILNFLRSWLTDSSPTLSIFLNGLSAMNRLLKNAHLLRSPHPSSLQRTFKYASLLRTSAALHLGIFDQPEK
jgi:hypothetical protein